MVVVVASSALVVGFLAGLPSFKIKQNWCPTCGDTLRCIDCATRRADQPAWVRLPEQPPTPPRT